MKSKILTTGLLIGFLVGCSETHQNTIDQSKRESSQAPTVKTIKPSPTTKSKATEINEFDSVSFPQDSCGDQLPNDLKAYPVKHYPVFIDYSESNLKSVKSKYCHDAFKKNRKTAGKNSIQVASFLSIERANKFRNFMIEKLGSGEVAEPTVIQAKRTYQETEASLSTQVGKAALLTSAQVQELISLNSKVKGSEVKVKFLVPTYIPSGFKIDIFRSWYQQYGSSIFRGPRYTIIYRSLRNSCFEISGGVIQPIGDEPTKYESIVNVSSSTIGKVSIGYTDFDRENGRSYLGFIQSMNRINIGKNEYTFGSPVYEVFSPQNGYKAINKCSRISVQEAVKIVESLKYLNP